MESSGATLGILDWAHYWIIIFVSESQNTE